MNQKKSLEQALHTLINSSETEKGCVVYALIKALRESCGLFKNSEKEEYREASQTVKETLDKILSDSISLETEEEWDEEFAESSPEEYIETIATTQPRMKVAEPLDTPSAKFKYLISNWNIKVEEWLKLPEANIEEPDTVKKFINSISALRSNILSNTFDTQTKILESLNNLWKEIIKLLEKSEYQIIPNSFEIDIDEPTGKIIYTCRPRQSKKEVELIVPGVNYKDEILSDPIWLISLPTDTNFPAAHMKSKLPSHWRGIFGELELLLIHTEIQDNAFCAIEGVNKNKIEPLKNCRENIINEIKRRGDVLLSTIQKEEKESLYRLATDYWRIEECFWSIFHDDNRPAGCSYFDRLRNRIQAWRTTLRKILKFHIRDFACGTDSLASINKYIGNIIIKPKKGIPQSTVVRELRPAIIVKIQGSSRLLKGRVIAT